MSGLDRFFFRRYDAEKYNCVHFVDEVWRELTGDSLRESLGAAFDRNVSLGMRRGFRSLAVPVSPCVALLRRRGADAHIGIYLDRSIFHIRETGVELMPVDVVARGFDRLGFYECLK